MIGKITQCQKKDRKSTGHKTFQTGFLVQEFMNLEWLHLAQILGDRLANLIRALWFLFILDKLTILGIDYSNMAVMVPTWRMDVQVTSLPTQKIFLPTRGSSYLRVYSHEGCQLFIDALL